MLPNQSSKAQHVVLIPLEVHDPFRSDTWPIGAQEPLALTICGKEHLGTCALDHLLLTQLPVIHPLLL